MDPSMATTLECCNEAFEILLHHHSDRIPKREEITKELTELTLATEAPGIQFTVSSQIDTNTNLPHLTITVDIEYFSIEDSSLHHAGGPDAFVAHGFAKSWLGVHYPHASEISVFTDLRKGIICKFRHEERGNVTVVYNTVPVSEVEVGMLNFDFEEPMPRFVLFAGCRYARVK